MNRILPLFCACVLALPVSAQVMGSPNANAPTLTKTFAFHEAGKLTIEYKAITMAEGTTLERIKNEPQMRDMVNRRASKSPIGHIEVTGDLTLAGKKLPAGKHAMFFTYGENGKWSINFQPKADGAEAAPISIEIPLVDAPAPTTRLVIDLIPVEEATTLHLGISFGKQTARMPVEAGAAKG